MAEETGPRTALRLRLGSADAGVACIPLDRVRHLAGYAALTGEPEEYFLGWLTFHAQMVPVFDLTRVIQDQPTPEAFGSRILIVEAAAGAPTPLIGLLAGGVTDTIALNDPTARPLRLDGVLPMLYTLIPPLPARA